MSDPFLGPKNSQHIGRHEIKKNAFTTVILEFFCQSKYSWKLKIRKIQKSTPPTIPYSLIVKNNFDESMEIFWINFYIKTKSRIGWKYSLFDNANFLKFTMDDGILALFIKFNPYLKYSKTYLTFTYHDLYKIDENKDIIYIKIFQIFCVKMFNRYH
jgi:hypothetical protein